MVHGHDSLVEVTPTAMVAGGSAIARDGTGRVVFVDGALPGERVMARVVTERANHATAHALDVLAASPERIAPPCPELARGCGACAWQHIDLDAQRRFKVDIVRDALRRIGKVDAPEIDVVALEPWAFRTTVRAVVVDGRAGYREGGSHDAVAVDSCLVAHPLLAELLVDGRYPGAAEVLLRCGARTGERMAAVQPKRVARQAIVPEGVRRDHVHELAAGRTWRVSARSFFQTRPDGVDALAGLVRAAAASSGTAAHDALDLYAGVGVFAGVLADDGWSVTAVEGDASACKDARVNLRELDVEVVQADVTTWSPPRAALVVADPSRNGLERSGVDVVRASEAGRVVLISCDAAAFGRDAGLLHAAGYTLSTSTLVDLFPHTAHVEVVSVFDR